MKLGLFEVFGDGSICRKAGDLNKYADILTEVGMALIGGLVIADDLFQLVHMSSCLITGICPDELKSINERILDRLERGKPYAIRSSSISESGGIGIFKTEFFVPTGDRARDLETLWHKELMVYLSEFDDDAIAWHIKTGTTPGMAILIQEVACQKIRDYYMPPLSGVAYTSLNGFPAVSVVPGLGTRAVKGLGMLYRSMVEGDWQFQDDMRHLEEWDVIDSVGDVKEIHGHGEDTARAIAFSYDAFSSIFDKLSQLKTHGEFYLEWVVSGGKLTCVQCSPYEDAIDVDTEFDSKNHFLFLKSGDVLHSGRVSCKSVLYVRKWDENVSAVLAAVNNNLTNYLLIVPSEALSLLANIHGYSFSFKHFSNAGAVVEDQVNYSAEQIIIMARMRIPKANHTGGRGASHFAQLCGKAKIPFVGGLCDWKTLIYMPGEEKRRGCKDILLWRTSAEVIVDAVKKEGKVLVSKSVKMNIYRPDQVRGWCHVLRDVANSLNDSDSETAGHFYSVHYLIGYASDDLANFDPFRINDEDVAEFGTESLRKSLTFVIEKGDELVVDPSWGSGLKIYLEEFLAHNSK